MNNGLPTLEEWKLIFEAGEQFKQSVCWDWMGEGDVFGVKCPETGEIYYCSIMGSGGAHFGIAAYRGTAGLNFFFEALEGQHVSSEIMYGQNCLMCSFEDREMMVKEDLQVIKSLGLKFRGRKQWTQFRDYSPGLYPWFINADQCKILTHILQQALQVAMRCRESKDHLYRRGDKLLVRTQQKDATGKAVWEDSYLTPQPSEISFTVFQLQDEVLVRKLKNIKTDNSYAVEAEILYVPAPVQEEGRPYYPMFCVLMERKEGIVLASEMIPQIESGGHIFLSMLLENIADSERKPSAIYVSKPAIKALFQGLCEQIGIPIHNAPQSKAMNEFRVGMETHFRSR